MYVCKFCGSEQIRTIGQPSADRTGVLYQKCQCGGCGRYPSFRTEPKKEVSTSVEVKAPRSAKILILDIETLMLQAFAWSLFKVNISIGQIVSSSFMCGWSVKWLFEDEVYSDILTPEEAIAQDDTRICLNLFKFMDEADIIIAHNGRKFDMPKINWRFLVHGINPPSPYVIIDTLQPFKKGGKLSPDSGKLDYVCQELGLGKKIHTDFSLWEKCFHGDPDSLKLMEEYNRNDVVMLEALYLKIRPWITSHPNIGLFIGDNINSCPTCGSIDLEWLENKPYMTQLGLYSSFRCRDCGSLGKSRSNELTKLKRNSMVTTCAR